MRIDPQFDTVAQKTRLANVVPGGPDSVATLGDAVWVAPSSGLVSRLDPRTGRVGQTIDANANPADVAVGAGAVWITDTDANTVTRIGPTGLLTPIEVGRGPTGLVVGAKAVWVADSLDDAIVRIDPNTRSPTATIPVGRTPIGVALGAGSVWVANSRSGTVTRIDPVTRKPLKTIPVGGSPQGVVFAAGRVWVTVAAGAVGTNAAARAAGTLRVDSRSDVGQGQVDTLDPARRRTR
jgi:YVTN family beta-propeller protein